MSPPRISGPSTAAANVCTTPELEVSSKPEARPAQTQTEANQSTVESWSGPKPGLGASTQTLSAPTTNGPTSRADLEQALVRQEKQEEALKDASAALTRAVRLNKGKINEATFSHEVTSELRSALRTLTPDQLKAVAREAVLQAYPGATEKRVAELTNDAMRELNSVANTEMTRGLQAFIVGKIKDGAENFRSVANDPQKLTAMLQHLQGLSKEARAQTLQAWGLDPAVGTLGPKELSTALTQRAALMDASAKTLAQTSGSDTLLFQLASYPGVAALFAREQRLDPESVAGRALGQVERSAKTEKTVRLVGDVVLGVTSAAAFGAAAAAVLATTAGAVAIAAPMTLANTARKLGGEENAVNTAKAGTSAGVMGRDAISTAEKHKRNVALAAAAETVAPVFGHGIGHVVNPVEAKALTQGIIEGSLALGISGLEIAKAPHAEEKPTGRDATAVVGRR